MEKEKIELISQVNKVYIYFHMEPSTADEFDNLSKMSIMALQLLHVQTVLGLKYKMYAIKPRKINSRS